MAGVVGKSVEDHETRRAPIENVGRLVVTGSELIAEDAAAAAG
jgi:hypothetical protein